GRIITAGKRVALARLSPFHVELLRPQGRFNAALVRAAEALCAPLSAPTRKLVGGQLLPRLRGLSEPSAWSLRGHREGLAGAAVLTLKRRYLVAAERGLGGVLENQRA